MTDYSESLNMMSALGQQPVTFLGEVSVEPLAAVGIIETALTEVKDNLTEFAASGTFEEDMLTVFGESANVDLGETIIDALAVGEDLPQITVVPVEQMNGASGGFDSLTGTVYLADSLINPNSVIASETPSVIASETPSVIASETPPVIASETKQSPNLVNVLTEELGHYIDSQLNRIDTPGDEGEHFAALVRGEVLSWEDVGRLRREDDRVRILGGLVEVEADDSFETAIDFGVLAQDVVFNDEIGYSRAGRRDTNDFYSFQVQGSGMLNLFMDGMFQDANVEVYGSGEELISTSKEDGLSSEFISVGLDKGSYFVRVFPQGNDSTPYRLSLNFIGPVTVAPEISIKDFATLEGNQGSTNAQFTVTLDTPTNQTVTVKYTTANQTAKANQDYKRTQGILTFQPGETTKNITVPILGDNKVEPKETFQLKLSNPTNAQLKDKLGIGTITNDDKPQPKISISDATIVEGNRGRKNAKFQVTLDAKPEETVRVNYATANQTAKANQDYKPTKSILTFKPGQTRKTITVPILGDTQIENNETFQLNLSKPRNAQLKDRRGIGTIRDNDFATLSIKDTQITEGDNGKKQAKFTVALNQKVNERVEVSYATSDGTAKQGSDYQKTNGKLTFKPGQTRKTITVPILGDTLDEDNEKFSVTLRKPSKGVKLGDKRAIGTIKDNGDKGQADGDTLKTAIDFGKLLEKEVIIDYIGVTIGQDPDTDDYYRFQLDREGTLRIFLDSLFDDANVELLGSGEELISQSNNDGTLAEEIIQFLDPDIYYVRVHRQGSNNTSYRLSLNFI